MKKSQKWKQQCIGSQLLIPALAIITMTSILTLTAFAATERQERALPYETQGGIIFHAWNMSFNEIITQLPYIAEAGFNTIQTSPIGASMFQNPYYDGDGNPTSEQTRSYVGTWWFLYQPRAFEIGNMLGTEAEFRALTAAAEEYGIRIIVDAIPNHTTAWYHELDDSIRRPELFHAVPGMVRNLIEILPCLMLESTRHVLGYWVW